MSQSGNNITFSEIVQHLLKTGCGDDQEPMAQKALAILAGVSEATVSKWVAGGEVSLAHLHQMRDQKQLPFWFTEACRELVDKPTRHGPRFRPPPHNTPSSFDGAGDMEQLDVDGDGRLTIHDAEILDARKQEVAAERRIHMEEGIGGRVVSPAELLEQRRLAGQEDELSRRESRVVEAVAMQTAGGA